MKFNPDNMLLTVADSWERLRRIDVFRLISETPGEFRRKMAEAIIQNRPELMKEVESVLTEAETMP